MRADAMAIAAAGKAKRIAAKIMMFVILIPVVMFLFGEAILHLWNWLMPAIFHLPTIGFWQAMGLLALSWIFFGGTRGMKGARPSYRGRWRRRMQERWEEMTPEERERFREWIRSRCGQAAVGAQPKEGGG